MDKGTSNTSASVLINAPASRDPRPQNQLPDSSRDADFRGLIPASFPLPGREYHLFGMATIRPSGFRNRRVTGVTRSGRQTSLNVTSGQSPVRRTRRSAVAQDYLRDGDLRPATRLRPLRIRKAGIVDPSRNRTVARFASSPAVTPSCEILGCAFVSAG